MISYFEHQAIILSEWFAPKTWLHSDIFIYFCEIIWSHREKRSAISNFQIGNSFLKPPPSQKKGPKLHSCNPWNWISRWWFQILYIFTPTWENDLWRAYFSDGLVQPPTRYESLWKEDLLGNLQLYWQALGSRAEDLHQRLWEMCTSANPPF